MLHDRVRGWLCATLLLLIAVGCSKKAPADERGGSSADIPVKNVEQPMVQKAPATAAGCSLASRQAAEAVDRVVAFLESLDKARTLAYEPNVAVPEPPVPPAGDDKATSFAAKPSADDYRRQKAAYDRAAAKASRALAAYVREFEKGWGRMDLGPKAKLTKLSTLAPKDLTLACAVENVEGKCSQTCYDLEGVSMRTGGWRELIPQACNRTPRTEGYSWVYTCKAVFHCGLNRETSVDTPGIKYKSQVFKIEFAKQYIGDRAGSKDFQQRIAAISKCSLVRIPKATAWKFKKGWVAEATPDDGWPELIRE